MQSATYSCILHTAHYALRTQQYAIRTTHCTDSELHTTRYILLTACCLLPTAVFFLLACLVDEGEAHKEEDVDLIHCRGLYQNELFSKDTSKQASHALMQTDTKAVATNGLARWLP